MSYDDSYDYFGDIVYEPGVPPKWQEFLFNIIYPGWYQDARYEEWNDFYRSETDPSHPEYIGNHVLGPTLTRDQWDV